MVDVPAVGQDGGFLCRGEPGRGAAPWQNQEARWPLWVMFVVQNIDSEMRNLLCASREPSSSSDPPKGACLYLSGSFAGGGAAGQSTPSRYSTDIIHPVLYPSCMIQTQKSLLKNLVIFF